MKKQKGLIMMLTCFLTCVLIVTAAIGTTLAFYSGKGDLNNKLTTKESSVYLDEVFDPTDKWLPGEEKTKEVKFGNRGTSDQVIRFKVELQWLDKDDDDTWVPVTTAPVAINWTNSFKDGIDWDDSFVADASDEGWYYYNKILEAGDETPAVMESVTFESKLANAVIGDSKDDFSSTTYRIKIYMESVDVNLDITDSEWSKVFVKGSGGSLTWSVATP